MINHIPPHAMALYADILDSKLRELDLRKELVHGTKGTYVKQVSDGNYYWYIQTYDAATKKTNKTYIGPDTEETREQILYLKNKLKEYRDFSTYEQLEQNVIMLRKARKLPLPSPVEEKTLSVLEKHGVFLNGAILIGTQAFRCYPLMLGRIFPDTITRTADIDLAADRSIKVAAYEKFEDIKKNIEKDLALIALPTLDRKNWSNQFYVEGSNLKLEILTTIVEESEPERLKKLRNIPFAAQPLELMNFLLKDPLQAVVPCGNGILVNVPAPERFALHKLWVSQQRPPHSPKVEKDLAQAAQLLETLQSLHRTNLVAAAIRDLAKIIKNDEKAKAGFLAGAATLGEQLSPILELIDREFGSDLTKSSRNGISEWDLS